MDIKTLKDNSLFTKRNTFGANTTKTDIIYFPTYLAEVNSSGNANDSNVFANRLFKLDLYELPELGFETSVKRAVEMGSKAATSFTETIEAQGISVDAIAKGLLESLKDLSEPPALNKATKSYTIVLPMPLELADKVENKYVEELGIAGKIAEMASGTSIGGIAAAAIRTVANNTGLAKPIINPGFQQDYQGTSPRTFSFSWEFVPVDANESKTIMVILSILKYWSLPKEKGVILHSTGIVKFSFGINNKHAMNALIAPSKLGCVINSLDVSYGDSNMQLYQDGMPKIIKVTINLTERRPLSRGDFAPNSKAGYK
jgi:hypothetical protein